MADYQETITIEIVIINETHNLLTNVCLILVKLFKTHR